MLLCKHSSTFCLASGHQQYLGWPSKDDRNQWLVHAQRLCRLMGSNCTLCAAHLNPPIRWSVPQHAAYHTNQ